MNKSNRIQLSNGIIFCIYSETDIINHQNYDSWGIEIQSSDTVYTTQKYPIYFDLYTGSDKIERYYSSYNKVLGDNGTFECTANLKISDKITFLVNDTWCIENERINLSRRVTVDGSLSNSGFLSGLILPVSKDLTQNEYKIFAPGMIYGTSKGLSTNSIGGQKTTSPNSNSDHCRIIREDRLPAPLYGIYFSNSKSLSMLNPTPMGNTTANDSHDQKVTTLIDEQFQFGSTGSISNDNQLQLVYSFPGSEGNITYKGNTYPEGQINKWRYRYHPVKNNFTQNYNLSIIVDCLTTCFSSEKNNNKSISANNNLKAKNIEVSDYYSKFCSSLWRKAWNILSPKLYKHDLNVIKKMLIETLFSQVECRNSLTGISNYLDSMKDEDIHFRDSKAIMGFTGRNIESAYFFLKYAHSLTNEETVIHNQSNKDKKKDYLLNLKRTAYSIIDSFTSINMSPPISEGFNLDTEEPELALPHSKRIYLRSLSDGFHSTAKAYLLELKQGIEHDNWLNWMRKFADWLLTQQYNNGGFPRAWEPVTGKIIEKSSVSSYNVIPFLIYFYQITKNSIYLESAENAGNFIWNNGQKNGYFIGGTIDNPNVLDKEACAISLNAYITLYEITKNNCWLERAQMAGDFAETWIYIWNVPMPEDENDTILDWNRKVSTVGMQLISTGHSLVDAFMAYNAGDYLKLYHYTKDEHYKEVSNILLHNTKSMIQTNKNHLGFKRSGWQQEHWSFAPLRGIGMHRGWLPWVATSQLSGIYECEELYSTLSSKINDNI